MTFARWYQDIYGFSPFPWQSRLAEQWASAIAVPTGTGKTSVIDAWLYRYITADDVPRRLWYVVDRRVLVDGAWRRAKELVGATEEDICVIRLRGGTFDREEIPRPDEPAIICSTVDQFGSRLLGQGYGVGRSSRPWHSALAGTDAIVVVDEAHISQPLLDTVGACRQHGADVQLLPMSATLVKSGGALVLDELDHNHPVLAQRLAAKKLAKLTTGKLPSHARALRKRGANTIAVWCNTVPTAIEVADELRKHGDTIVITGRDRQYDRDQLMGTWHDRLKSGSCEYPQVYVVTTQCLEVGVDWDFQAMVTQCCSIDSLLQRMGRLDRLGNAGESHAVIVKPRKNEPVYGETAMVTYDWLKGIATDDVVDVGLSNRDLATPAQGCTRDEPVTPWLSSTHLDAWSMYPGKAATSKPRDHLGLELRGLAGSTMLGWMAAIGVARLTGCPLSWRRRGPRWTAVLGSDMTHEDLASLLHDRTRENPYAMSSDKNLNNITLDEWLSWPEEWRIASHYQTAEGLQKSRLFSSGSNGKQFTVSIDKMNHGIGHEDFLAAIAGPWRPRKGCGLGWGENEHQSHGDRWADPSDTSDPGNSIVFWGPTRLAVESLPLIPAWIPGRKGMTWPVWREPLSPDAIRGRIIACAGDEIWTSPRTHHGKGRYTFGQSRPAAKSWPEIPDITPWLHGLGAEDTDCRVLWRDDTSPEALAAMPPRMPETASVSLRTIRKLDERVTRYRGSDDIEVIDSRAVAPGDVVVVAAGTEIAPTPPTDIAEKASRSAKQPRIRVFGAEAIEWLETLSDHEILERVEHDMQRPEVLPYPRGFVIAERTITSQRAGHPVTLASHNRDVAALAREIASKVRESIANTCEQAGLHHDDGKTDPRFQRWLGASDELWAKSGQTQSQINAMWALSGYPRGQRHELLSAAITDGSDDLARWLIASHHGHCRPYAPPQRDIAPIEVEGVMTDDVVTGHDNRYWRLVREHGWWSISLLHGILVASDHEVSARSEVTAKTGGPLA